MKYKYKHKKVVFKIRSVYKDSVNTILDKQDCL